MLALTKENSAAIFLVLQRQCEADVVIDLAAPWNNIRHLGNEIHVKADAQETEEHQHAAATASVVVILTLENVVGRVADAIRARIRRIWQGGASYWIKGNAITSLVRGMTSHNRNDVAWRYRGHCKKFHDDTALFWSRNPA